MAEEKKTYRNPVPTVDIIIEREEGKIILIERKNPPFGWAIPGGFVDYGETLETAAAREAKEETSLDVELLCQFHTYSDPKRDCRLHTISTVFIAKSDGTPIAADDAKNIGVFSENDLPEPIAFDHGSIIKAYFEYKRTGKLPK
jgi:ADP-ribose pyrophosphatase YjhB (NUDIX family)